MCKAHIWYGDRWACTSVVPAKHDRGLTLPPTCELLTITHVPYILPHTCQMKTNHNAVKNKFTLQPSWPWTPGSLTFTPAPLTFHSTLHITWHVYCSFFSHTETHSLVGNSLQNCSGVEDWFGYRQLFYSDQQLARRVGTNCWVLINLTILTSADKLNTETELCKITNHEIYCEYVSDNWHGNFKRQT